MWKKKSYFSRARETDKTSVSTDLAWTNAIAGWGSNDPAIIQKSGAGLIYAIAGVCHQMCNSVMYPSKPVGYKYGYLNFAPGYWASHTIYGTYGYSPRPVIESLRMHALEKKKPEMQQTNTGLSGISEDSLSAEAMIMSQISYEPDDYELVDFLNNTYQIERNAFISEGFLASYKQILKRKQEIDKRLLQGKYDSTDKVANDLNELLVDTSKLIFQLYDEEESTESLGWSLEEEISAAASIVDSDLIDLDLCKQLGVNIKIEQF